ncbi:MAG: TonB-dependent receptor [Cyclobacteriaceae bacterium]|nr:TonB-dependent receptor [Cyclobacteriaceae bacterium]
MKRSLLVLVAWMICLSSFAQERVISGKITSTEDGSPVPGVNVLVKGTTIGTASDGNGSYSISLPEGGTTLIFSFIGFKTTEVTVGSRSIVDVAIESDATQLSEVVVTGYGSQLKQDLTGNIAKVSGADIQNAPVSSFEQALQGRAAGVYVNSQSGKLGQAISVRVRGNSSISASNQPLYVLDGVPLTTASQSNYGGATNPLIDLNPNDIESIEVLKDAAAGAIYGSRAANGVVLITTKKGKSGRTSINFNYQTGFSESTKRVPFLNSEQYAELLYEGAKYIDDDNGTPYDDEFSETVYVTDWMQYFSYDQWQANPTKTYEWQDVVFQKGSYQQADLQFSGGNENTKFYLSGQYLKQGGIMIGNNLDRLTARLNIENKATDWLTIGLNMNFARTLNRRLPDDNAFSNPLQSVALMPMTPSIDPNTGLPAGTPPGDVNIPMYYNPQITVDYAKYTAESFRNFSNAFATFKLMPGLIFQTELGLDLLTQNEESYFQSQTKRNQTRATRGLGSNRGTFIVNYNTNNYFNYTKRFGKSDLGVTLGMQFQESTSKYNFVEGMDFPSDSYQKIASAATISGGSSSETNYAFLSYFLRANYKFSDKYLFSASGRVDGSSRFGVNNRYGFFPAASAGWIMSEEGFLKSIDVLSFLKLRTSYGIVGNSEIGNFPQLGLFTGGSSYAGIGGQSPSQIGNPDLKWETSKQLDIGVDFGFFGNRLTGEIDYYTRTSEDLLLNVNIPASTGFRSVVKNLGSIENKGFELVLNSQNTVGDLKWSTSFNIATNRGKILDIQGQVIEGGVGGLNRAMEGENLGVFFTVEYAGVNPDNGDAQFYKNTKNADGTIDRTIVGNADYNQAQRVVVGDPNPKFIGGITNTFSYKGFDFSFLFSGVFGNDVSVYGMGQYSMANMIYEDNQTADQMNRWQNPGDITNVPQARYYYGNGNQRSSRFIVDGSFVRLRNVNFGYTFSKDMLKAIKLQSARLYVSGQNLLTFTKDYPLWDPEVNADSFDSNISKGNDFYTPPQPRTILFGVNIGF